MLVLTRRLGEQIVLGDDVVVTVVAASPGRVRIGIEAPASTPIHRREIVVDACELTPSRPKKRRARAELLAHASHD